MTDHAEPSPFTRRSLLAGLGVVGAGVLFDTTGADALQPALAPWPADVGVPNPDLSYLPFDALAFFADNGSRYSDDTSGTGVLAPPGKISVALSLPVGSIIKRVNVAYQGLPVASIVARPMGSPTAPVTTALAPLQAGGGPKSNTLELLAPVTVAAATTYSLRFQLPAPGGSTVYGAEVGYIPPTQTFIPFSGATPRVLDTRSGAKLAPGEERTVSLGFSSARSAVLNVTVTGTEGAGGYVAVFRSGIVWPGNSSINWFGPDQNLANGVITATNAGAITIRGGDNKTHVIIDRIGWLV